LQRTYVEPWHSTKYNVPAKRRLIQYANSFAFFYQEFSVLKSVSCRCAALTSIRPHTYSTTLVDLFVKQATYYWRCKRSMGERDMAARYSRHNRSWTLRPPALLFFNSDFHFESGFTSWTLINVKDNRWDVFC
jgi:hypothetical protein